jgi:ribose transport system permease protein
MSSLGARIAAVQRRAPLLQAVALAIVFSYGAGSIDGFATAPSLRAMLVIAALLGIAALGQTIVVLVGGIDLSVPAFIAAGATMTAVLPSSHHWPFALVLALLVAVPAVLGGMAGWICHRFRVEPLILTLANAAVVAGALSVWRKGTTTGSAPEWLTTFTSVTAKTFGLAVPPVVVAWIVIAIVVSLLLHRTRPGRYLYATGINPRAGDLAGVPTTRVWIASFALSATIASLTGMLLAGFAGAADQTIGDPYLFLGLGAIVLGGVSLVGERSDRDDYSRTVVGALILTVLTTILAARGASPADQQMVFGAMILAVAALTGRRRRLKDAI